MSWWQTLIIGTVPAAFTAAGLLLQQRSTATTERLRLADAPDEREHQRQLARDEREAERAARADARAAALADHWREARLDSHRAGIAVLDSIIGEFHELIRQISDKNSEREVETPDLFEMNDRAQAPYADVALLGSTESAEAYKRVQNSLTVLNMRTTLYSFTTTQEEEERKERRTDAYHALHESQKYLEEYRRTAKSDIGTDFEGRE